MERQSPPHRQDREFEGSGDLTTNSTGEQRQLQQQYNKMIDDAHTMDRNEHGPDVTREQDGAAAAAAGVKQRNNGIAKRDEQESTSDDNDTTSADDDGDDQSKEEEEEEDTGAAASDTTQGKRRRRGRYTKRACSNCRLAHAACDDGRPCKRCIDLGKEDSCVDVERKKTRKRAQRTHRPSIFEQTEHVYEQLTDFMPMLGMLELGPSSPIVPTAAATAGSNGTTAAAAAVEEDEKKKNKKPTVRRRGRGKQKDDTQDVKVDAEVKNERKGERKVRVKKEKNAADGVKGGRQRPQRKKKTVSADGSEKAEGGPKRGDRRRKQISKTGDVAIKPEEQGENHAQDQQQLWQQQQQLTMAEEGDGQIFAMSDPTFAGDSNLFGQNDVEIVDELLDDFHIGQSTVAESEMPDLLREHMDTITAAATSDLHRHYGLFEENLLDQSEQTGRGIEDHLSDAAEDTMDNLAIDQFFSDEINDNKISHHQAAEESLIPSQVFTPDFDIDAEQNEAPLTQEDAQRHHQKLSELLIKALAEQSSQQDATHKNQTSELQEGSTDMEERATTSDDVATVSESNMRMLQDVLVSYVKQNQELKDLRALVKQLQQLIITVGIAHAQQQRQRMPLHPQQPLE